MHNNAIYWAIFLYILHNRIFFYKLVITPVRTAHCGARGCAFWRKKAPKFASHRHDFWGRASPRRLLQVFSETVISDRDDWFLLSASGECVFIGGIMLEKWCFFYIRQARTLDFCHYFIYRFREWSHNDTNRKTQSWKLGFKADMTAVGASKERIKFNIATVHRDSCWSSLFTLGTCAKLSFKKAWRSPLWYRASRQKNNPDRLRLWRSGWLWVH